MAAVCQMVKHDKKGGDPMKNQIRFGISWSMILNPQGPSAREVKKALIDKGDSFFWRALTIPESSDAWESVVFENIHFPQGMDNAQTVFDLLEGYHVTGMKFEINGLHPYRYLNRLWLLAADLEKASDDAAIALKHTRSWIGDWRIGKIRQDLEKAMKYFRASIVQPE